MDWQQVTKGVFLHGLGHKVNSGDQFMLVKNKFYFFTYINQIYLVYF